jgi:hypothetical protein
MRITDRCSADPVFQARNLYHHIRLMRERLDRLAAARKAFEVAVGG